VTGFSPRFLREVVRELEVVGRRIDRLDERIEKAKGQAAKDRLSEERARQARYERWLRDNLLK
jgi:hypothetical protein